MLTLEELDFLIEKRIRDQAITEIQARKRLEEYYRISLEKEKDKKKKKKKF